MSKRYRAQIIRGAVARGVVHYGCDCNLKISGVGEHERLPAALLAAAIPGKVTQYCPQGETIEIPENWLYMAKHASTPTARAWWRKKCGISEEN
ncbi:hypothetical protein E6W39_18870 [Kitasatospora acidiphila]|uniref:Uncharacterized protein n=1 Tax=Kitasatospora acidiphila TaxID=2567942 RepID=A0A540W4Q7_9ACTN|nr:hypothetical protein [Kitasatospora acidiphila]TQF03917.1 hypothetical protein E6W39_18870 [Kitasatospora acidiphila]